MTRQIKKIIGIGMLAALFAGAAYAEPAAERRFIPLASARRSAVSHPMPLPSHGSRISGNPAYAPAAAAAEKISARAAAGPWPSHEQAQQIISLFSAAK